MNTGLSVPRTVICMLCAAFFGGAAWGGSITQYFPAAAAGQPQPAPESGWRIHWNVLKTGSHGYGGSAVLEFDRIEFMRGYADDGSEDWHTVLTNLAMAEMYVPYNDGEEIWDITGYSFSHTGTKSSYLPNSGIIEGGLDSGGVVIWELRDDNVRYMDNNDSDRVRRGQTLRLWATLSAGNYRYILSYSFVDDGTIRVRAAGTAENLQDVPVTDNSGVHVHMPAWRMEFDLGGPSNLTVEVVERLADLVSGGASIRARPFNGGFEGGEIWEPDKFTTLKITNPAILNRHQPPLPISYTLAPRRTGSTRTQRPYTKFDFWVSRTRPDSAYRRALAPELRFIDVPDKVSNPESIVREPVVVWYKSGLHHIPRTEDFGPTGWAAGDGVALVMGVGFDLVPRNFWHRTPLHSR